jgi:hypothetical protein
VSRERFVCGTHQDSGRGANITTIYQRRKDKKLIDREIEELRSLEATRRGGKASGIISFLLFKSGFAEGRDHPSSYSSLPSPFRSENVRTKACVVLEAVELVGK